MADAGAPLTEEQMRVMEYVLTHELMDCTDAVIEASVPGGVNLLVDLETRGLAASDVDATLRARVWIIVNAGGDAYDDTRGVS